MPISVPVASRTGRPLILRCSISRIASSTEASGSTVSTSGVITSLAFMTRSVADKHDSAVPGYGYCGRSNAWSIVTPRISLMNLPKLQTGNLTALARAAEAGGVAGGGALSPADRSNVVRFARGRVARQAPEGALPANTVLPATANLAADR